MACSSYLPRIAWRLGPTTTIQVHPAAACSTFGSRGVLPVVPGIVTASWHEYSARPPDDFIVHVCGWSQAAAGYCRTLFGFEPNDKA